MYKEEETNKNEETRCCTFIMDDNDDCEPESNVLRSILKHEKINDKDFIELRANLESFQAFLDNVIIRDALLDELQCYTIEGKANEILIILEMLLRHMEKNEYNTEVNTFLFSVLIKSFCVTEDQVYFKYLAILLCTDVFNTHTFNEEYETFIEIVACFFDFAILIIKDNILDDICKIYFQE